MKKLIPLVVIASLFLGDIAFAQLKPGDSAGMSGGGGGGGAPQTPWASAINGNGKTLSGASHIVPGSSNSADVGSFLLPMRTNWVNVLNFKGRIIGPFDSLYIGSQAGDVAVPAATHYNTIIGDHAGLVLAPNLAGTCDPFCDGTINTFFGAGAGHSATTAKLNSLFGVDSGATLTTGNQNVALGVDSFQLGTTFSAGVAIGLRAGALNNDDYTTDIGYSAGEFATNGQANVAIGAYARRNIIRGSNDTVIGTYAMSGSTNQSDGLNVFIGTYAGYYQFGNKNVGVGAYALQSALTSHDFGNAGNTAIGYGSLINAVWPGGFNAALGQDSGNGNTSGDHNTYLGYQADTSLATVIDSTAVGSLASVNKSHQVVIGATTVTQTLIRGCLELSNTVGNTSRFIFRAGTNYDGNGLTVVSNGNVAVGGSAVALTRFTVDGGASGGAVAVTGSDATATPFTLANTAASFANSLLYGPVTRAANSAYNFIDMRANSVQTFVVRGDGQVTANSLGLGTLAPSATIDSTGQVRMASGIVSNTTTYFDSLGSRQIVGNFKDASTTLGTNFGIWNRVTDSLGFWNPNSASNDFRMAGGLTSSNIVAAGGGTNRLGQTTLDSGIEFSAFSTTVLTNMYTAVTNSMNFGSTSVGAVSDLPVYTVGAAEGDECTVTPSSAVMASIIGSFTAFGSNNYVYIRFTPTAAAQDPASGTFRVVARRFR